MPPTHYLELNNADYIVLLAVLIQIQTQEIPVQVSEVR